MTEPEMLVDGLRFAWTQITDEYKKHPSDQRMFWHENDLLAQLYFRIMESIKERELIDIHASVKIDPSLYEGDLKAAMARALPRIRAIRNRNNYVDLVANNKQDISNPFLLCVEIKYWYYEMQELKDELRNDLERLRILKEENVTKDTSCIILNARYRNRTVLLKAAEKMLSECEQRFGLIGLVFHDPNL